MHCKTINFIYLFLLTFFLNSSYAQNNDDNANYIIKKELELTNDSSYWDNHSCWVFNCQWTQSCCRVRNI